MHRLICCGLVLASAMGSAIMSPVLAADPTGDWRVKDGVANIRVAICNDKLWGAVSWEMKPGGIDRENPDSAKKTRPTLGMPILLGLVKKNAAKDEWYGKLYDARGGKFWDSRVSSTKPDEINVNGCVMGFCELGETWKRPPATGPGSMAEGAKGPSAIPASTNPNMMAPPGAKMTPASKAATAKAPAPKGTAPVAAPGASADIGDVCALPEVAAGVVP
jgi:uncharacterized protein (DUF2147 family)